MQELLVHAQMLLRKYSTLQAYELAKSGSLDETDISYHAPQGSPWSRPLQFTDHQRRHKASKTQSLDILVETQTEPVRSTVPGDLFEGRPHRFDDADSESDQGDTTVPFLKNAEERPSGSLQSTIGGDNASENSPVCYEGDWPLANSILMMHDGILFLEVCQAVASGDIGRVWEVLKVREGSLSVTSLLY